MITHRSEEFDNESVTVTLEWLDLGSNTVFYDVSIILPSISMTWLAGNASIELSLFYNTPYYLSATAILCERASTPIITRLSYGEHSKVIIFFFCKIHNTVLQCHCIANTVLSQC